MADIALTTAQIAVLDQANADIFTIQPSLTITPGQVVSFNSSGLGILADANGAGVIAQARGICLERAGVNQGCGILRRGTISGFTLTGLAYGAKVYLSDTAGALADAAGTLSVPIGQVVPTSDITPEKVLYVDFDWVDGYA